VEIVGKMGEESVRKKSKDRGLARNGLFDRYGQRGGEQGEKYSGDRQSGGLGEEKSGME
jgi:hypothetical protein